MAISQNYRHVTENPKAYVEQTIREAKKLHRLVSLSANLSGLCKSHNWLNFTSDEELERLRIRRNLDLQSLLKAIEANPHECSKDSLITFLGKRVHTYTLDFLKASLSEDRRSIIQLYHDLKTIQTKPPMQKTLTGKNGPTFIVSYPVWESKLSPKKNDKGISCILKWTDDSEITAHRFFEAFATGFHFKRNCYERECFFVPKLTYFDLDKGMLFEKNHTYSLSNDEKSYLREQLNGSVTDYQLPKPEFHFPNKLVARIEKVSGKNFPQFAQADFPGLSDDIKASLFRRLGKIAFLDFVFGNTDRLFSIDNDTVALSDYESNLDNLMLQSLDGGVAIFLIDNAIDKFFLEDGFRERYLTLISETFSSPDFSKILTKSVVEGITQRMKEVRFSTSFQNDLSRLGQENIQQGLEEMKESFQTLALNYSRNPKPLKECFAGLNQEISDAISERIKTVSAILKKPTALTQELSSTTPQFNGSFSTSLDSSPSKWLISPHTSLRNFLWEISNHCKGTKEDELFFQTTFAPEIPQEQISESVTTILSIINEIKNIEIPKHRFKKMQELNDLVNHVLEVEFHTPRPNLSPLEGIAPSPLIAHSHLSIILDPLQLQQTHLEPREFSIPPPFIPISTPPYQRKLASKEHLTLREQMPPTQFPHQQKPKIHSHL